jgi:hypothetical protein
MSSSYGQDIINETFEEKFFQRYRKVNPGKKRKSKRKNKRKKENPKEGEFRLKSKFRHRL